MDIEKMNCQSFTIQKFAVAFQEIPSCLNRPRHISLGG